MEGHGPVPPKSGKHQESARDAGGDGHGPGVARDVFDPGASRGRSGSGHDRNRSKWRRPRIRVRRLVGFPALAPPHLRGKQGGRPLRVQTRRRPAWRRALRPPRRVPGEGRRDGIHRRRSPRSAAPCLRTRGRQGLGLREGPRLGHPGQRAVVAGARSRGIRRRGRCLDRPGEAPAERRGRRVVLPERHEVGWKNHRTRHLLRCPSRAHRLAAEVLCVPGRQDRIGTRDSNAGT